MLGFYACAIFLLVIVTLTQAIAGQFPRAAVALTVLGVLGAAAGVGFNIDNIHGALFDDMYIVDEGGLASVLVANVPGLMFPLAWVGIGIALLRGGVQPRFSAITLIVAGALFPVARIGDVARAGDRRRPAVLSSRWRRWAWRSCRDASCCRRAAGS